MLNLLVGCLNLGLVMGHANGAGNCDNAPGAASSMGTYATAGTAWSFAGPTTGVNSGDTITLTISKSGAGNIQYKGISLYCENSATNAKIGSFTYPSNFQSNSYCGGGNEGLTHTTAAVKTVTTFSWTAPVTTAALNVVCKGIAFNNQNQWQPFATASFGIAAGSAAPTTAGTTLAPTTAAPAPAPSSAETVGVSMAACALALAMMA